MASFASKLSALKASAQRAARGAGLSQLTTGAANLGKVTTEQVKRLASTSLGKLITMLQAPGRKTGTVGREREIQGMADFLRAAGFEVTKKREPVAFEWGPEVETQPKPRVQESTREIPDDVTMIRVKSSNVHSIGFREEAKEHGTLFIRFLGQVGNRRAGAGALYEYFDVPLSLWKAFESASSKGKFVWDEIRVRGTVSGHRYSYELAGTGPRGYIPRRASLKRGEAGEFYLPRRFQGRQSELPAQRVHLRGPNPQRGPGSSKLILKRGKR